MSLYRNSELGALIGDTLNRLAQPDMPNQSEPALTRERQLYGVLLRVLCELARVRGEALQRADDYDG